MTRAGKEQNASIMTKCAICGKDIFVPVVKMWVYKVYDNHEDGVLKYFCSWSCMRKHEKMFEEERQRRKGNIGIKPGRKIIED